MCVKETELRGVSISFFFLRRGGEREREREREKSKSPRALSLSRILPSEAPSTKRRNKTHRLLRVLALQEEQLRDDQPGAHVVDRPPDDDDALAEQAGVDVEGALSSRGRLDDHGDEAVHRFRFPPFRSRGGRGRGEG
jgi:hypothetical protein